MGDIHREMNKLFGVLEREIHEVKLRQDNVAHRFELQNLDERVVRLEKGVS